MSLFSTSGRYWLVGVVVIVSLMAPTAAAAVPSRQEVLQMLDREPMTPANWSRWRPRLLEWIGDPGRTADPAYHAAWAMILNQADQNGELTGDFANDAFAWYALGRAELSGTKKGKILDAARRSENATRRSLQLDANFARAQRNLALVLFIQETEEWRAGAAPQSSKQFKAEQALALAQRLDPTLSVAVIPGQAALHKEQYTRAESLLLAAARESPEDADTANQLAQAIVLNPKRTKYNLTYYVGLAKELEKAGANLLAIKDMAGLCKPYAARLLVRALRQEVGLPIHFHTHDCAGGQVATLLLAATEGVSIVDTAAAPFSASRRCPVKRELPARGPSPSETSSSALPAVSTWRECRHSMSFKKRVLPGCKWRVTARPP